VEYKNLKYSELFKSPFLIFKNDIQTLNILLLFFELIFKIKNGDLKSSKHSKFLHPISSYKEFNEYDKLEFRDDLIYIFCVKPP
jgi:hypothetical protein